MWEKPRQPIDCREITLRDGYNNGKSTKATTSCTPSSPHTAVTMEATTSFSLCVCRSHCHYMQLHINYTTNNVQLHTIFALSHIYTHMTFGLFTHMAPRGSLEHIHICVPSNLSGRSPPGLLSFPSGGNCFPTESTTKRPLPWWQSWRRYGP